MASKIQRNFTVDKDKWNAKELKNLSKFSRFKDKKALHKALVLIRDSKKTYRDIAKETGVSYPIVANFGRAIRKYEPRYDFLVPKSKVIEEQPPIVEETKEEEKDEVIDETADELHYDDVPRETEEPKESVISISGDSSPHKYSKGLNELLININHKGLTIEEYKGNIIKTLLSLEHLEDEKLNFTFIVSKF